MHQAILFTQIALVSFGVAYAALNHKRIAGHVSKIFGSKNSIGDAEKVPIKEPEMQQLTPLPSLTPDKVKEYDDRPWRPFRWPYHQTMSIFKLDLNHWLDMDKWYIRYIEEKKKIFNIYGKEYCDWLPESKESCEELLEIIVEHMLTRYPSLFKKTETGVHNLITDEHLDLTKPYKMHPLHLIGKLAKEDFYIVQKRADDMHYLVAAAVPFPGGYFTVQDKLGKHLDIIHKDVPYYHEKLKVSMERWFARMKPTDPVERASWYISWDHELLCSKVYTYKNGESMPEVPFEKFTVRVERQTLRRLPKSKAIIFTNHPVFYTIDEMKDEPMVPSILKKVILEGPEKIVKYKNFAVIEKHIIPYLDRLIQRQIDMGLIKEDQPVKTLPTYPFAHWADVSSDTGEGWTNPMAGCPVAH